MEENVSIDEISTLICNIKSTNMNTRLNALANIPIIAKELGRERTENELIPYVMDITDHTSSCLKKISKSLYKTLEAIPEIDIKLILDSLKVIGEKEDQEIRIAVTKGFFFVGRILLTNSKNTRKASTPDSPTSSSEKIDINISADNEKSDNAFYNVFLNYIYSSLCEAKWYPLRCVGSSLLCAFYRKVPKTDHKKVKTILLQLSTDKSVVVRKTTAIALPSLINPSICTILNITNTNTIFDTSKLARTSSGSSSSITQSVKDICSRLLKNLSSDKSASVLIEVPQSIALFAEVGYNEAINNSISKPPDSKAEKSSSSPQTNSLSALNEGLESLYESIVEACKKVYDSNVWQAQSVLISYLDQIFLLKYRSNTSNSSASNNSSHRKRSASYSLILLPKCALRFIRNISKTSASQDDSEESGTVIRASIARQLSFIFRSRCFDKEKDEFEKFAKFLISDNSPEVRKAAAESLGGIFTNHRGGDEDIPPFIEQALSGLLDDGEVEVKLGALKSIAESGVVVNSASKNLRELITNDNNNDIDEESGMKMPKRINWRMRKSIAELVPKMASCIDSAQFEKYKLIEIVRLLINDDADQVRKATVSSLHQLTSKFGEEWTNQVLVPIINDCYFKNKNDYNIRKTAVEAVISLRLRDGCKELLKAAVSDPVPNVRLVLARDLPRSSTNILQKLMKDEDEDVAYFASLKNEK
ncbi:hypothetical protein M9Y10_031762 [Tritrichomonas musculus]|uniref:HEAT repeat family protein n=1 Tax=Tritrichomonas musculus TaxID=1915356 RepID=A0ABR2GZP8_9EUKA